ncbi:DUF6630 family protein [Flavobacterium hercynium]|uniref:Uncharacterized protein n=1 Tax=Flavobacterium hercynium TaxID=387094 RepID=A0A226HDI9_9FLAO|nr:hypothetical protein [Flavobacterium hercynium]OXA92245.1 hypothetical protein B0A66_10830 [Flavobacterium hercynium]SMP24050.1 hypothetical protein SAMN06265346_10814 [Flavobacterium hercynium]
MKNFFSNLFGRNNDPESIVSFDIINSIYSYLVNEQSKLEFKIKGIHENVFVNMYSFPNSFDYDEPRKEIKEAGLNNSYEVLNELYKKLNIGLVSEEEVSKELEFDYIHIEFYTKPSPEMKSHLNYVLHNFMIFFCCTNSLETNDFRILHKTGHFFNYTKSLLEAEYIDIKTPVTDIQKIGFKEFEKVIQGICQYLKIEIPESIVLPSQENLLFDENDVTIEDFEEFIQLVARQDVEEKLVKKQAKKLFKNYKKGAANYHASVDGHFDFFESVDCWNSDWKFDPEDAEYFISDMIGQDLNFEYPEETYSHNLFPYIQSALEKLDLELMTYDTHGDNYLFFVANKKDVDRILELSELTKIEVNQL